MAGFEVLDVQSLRPHYALTLAAWVARLEANWGAAVAAAGEEVAGTWRLHMSAARNGFEHGDTDASQLLLARPQDDGTPARLPTRPWWRRGPSHAGNLSPGWRRLRASAAGTAAGSSRRSDRCPPST